MNSKWDKRFLDLARLVSTWSKDPSTKVGAVIVRPNKTIASIGYNGFPRSLNDNLEDLNDRARKYPRIIHAEMNAILNSTEDLSGYTLYVYPLPPCERCAVHIVQAGIHKVITVTSDNALWKDSNAIAEEIFHDCGLSVVYY